MGERERGGDGFGFAGLDRVFFVFFLFLGALSSRARERRRRRELVWSYLMFLRKIFLTFFSPGVLFRWGSKDTLALFWGTTDWRDLIAPGYQFR